ncbi:MAG: enoyl-CoA hydratase-related protein [Acidimicrobiales bacterium]
MTSPTAGTATLLHIASGVATITLNRPDNRNALSVELVNSFGDHLDTALADPTVRAIVITNVGNTFCAGADLKAPGPPDPANRSFLDIFDLILDSPKPIIGRIDGHALAGGVGLAASCDISVMNAEAQLGFTEVRIGVAPAVISVVCLPKLRPADAMELFLSGERITAARAAEVGLINHAAAPDQLDAKVDEVLGKVLRGGPNALAASKLLVRKVPGFGSRREAFEWTGPFSASLFASEEGVEGIAAFRERRNASWIPEGR